MNDILTTIDLSTDKNRLSHMFQESCLVGIAAELELLTTTLADANFLCYKANMGILKARRSFLPAQAIADEEFTARSVGESRVESKASINKLISSHMGDGSVQVSPAGATWDTDDIVYSIGEMADRILIEGIKCEAFRHENSSDPRIVQSEEWAIRVYTYLQAKLVEVAAKGSYECLSETRTYDLTGLE
jgi:hypothetical protein